MLPRLLEVFIENAFRMERLLEGAPHLARAPRCLLSRSLSLESSAGTRRVSKKKRMETLLGPSVLLVESQLPHDGAIPAGDLRETTWLVVWDKSARYGHTGAVGSGA